MTDIHDLIVQLSDSDPLKRSAAAGELRTLGDPAGELPLVRALADPDPDVRTAAAYALGTVGSEAAVPALVLATQDEDEEVWDNAFLSLIDIGGPAVTHAVSLAHSEDEDLRILALRIIGELTRLDDSRLVEAVRECLGDPSASVRSAAVRAVPGPGYSPLEHQFSPVLRLVAEIAKADPAAEVRTNAAWVLGFYGGTDARQALEAAGRDPDAGVRDAAKEALARIIGTHPS